MVHQQTLTNESSTTDAPPKLDIYCFTHRLSKLQETPSPFWKSSINCLVLSCFGAIFCTWISGFLFILSIAFWARFSMFQVMDSFLAALDDAPPMLETFEESQKRVFISQMTFLSAFAFDLDLFQSRCRHWIFFHAVPSLLSVCPKIHPN